MDGLVVIDAEGLIVVALFVLLCVLAWRVVGAQPEPDVVVFSADGAESGLRGSPRTSAFHAK